ncbi:hypothetical protein BD310DRAFT_940126 [Dichomitus squalens]|uniref:Secreted protein n=1 Tax=Dichomitus squalens TaxID=114155 RepID=A0A4Q9PCK6_9APHY|nr:hypothetical protein BD310DRAFT_940126 [Dichomitus squalens]
MFVAAVTAWHCYILVILLENRRTGFGYATQNTARGPCRDHVLLKHSSTTGSEHQAEVYVQFLDMSVWCGHDHKVEDIVGARKPEDG